MSTRPQVPLVSTTDAAVGIMDGAYFTGRKEILDYLNKTLDMNLVKIEQTASGAVACQLMDYAFPGSVPMKRVNWEAKLDFQFIENYKILQAAFVKCNIQKYIDVDRLVRAKYQDNLEFCQWLKAFFENTAPAGREDYDPLARRMLGKGGNNLETHFLPCNDTKNAIDRPKSSSGNTLSCPVMNGPLRPSLSNVSNTTSASVVSNSLKRTHSKNNPSSPSSGNYPSVQPARSRDSILSVDTRTVGSKAKRGTASTTLSSPRRSTAVSTTNDQARLRSKLNDLMERNAELELSLSNVDRERNFYFEKLRGIEVMLQIHEEKGTGSNDPVKLISDIFRVLYATVEDNLVVTDEGEILGDSSPTSMLNDTFVVEDSSVMEDAY